MADIYATGGWGGDEMVRHQRRNYRHIPATGILALAGSRIEYVYKHINTDKEVTPVNAVRWNVAVSADTDKSLRMFLAGNGGGRKRDLSRVIEEAVLAYIFDHTARQVKSGINDMSGDDIDSLVNEALDWARRGR